MYLKSYLRVRSPRFRDPEIVREKEGGVLYEAERQGRQRSKEEGSFGFLKETLSPN